MSIAMNSNIKQDMGYSNQNTTSNSLPPLNSEEQQAQRVIRFREPVQEASSRSRRVSRLPTVQRKNSLVAFEPMVAKFVKNGDKFFEGVQLNISPRVIRSWEVLLAELSLRIDLPAGVRRIYTPDGGSKVNSLSELEHHKIYVCASTEPFKRIDYKKVKNPDWKTTRPRPSHTIPPSSVFSKSFPLVPVDLNTSFASTVSNSAGESLRDSSLDSGGSMSRVRRMSRTRRPSRPMRLSSITELDSSFLAANTNTAPNNPVSPTTCNAKPTAITVYQNGPPPRHSVLIYLKREAIRSWEEAKKLIGENLPSTNGCLRLYRPNGEEVHSLSQLWRAGSMLIAAGKEKFDIADFMAGAGAPVPTLSQLQVPSVEKPTGTALPIRGASLNGSTSAESSHDTGDTGCGIVAEEAEPSNSLNLDGGRKEGAKGHVQSMPDKRDEAKVKPVRDNRLPRLATKDADMLSEDAGKAVHRSETSLKKEQSPEERALTSEESESSSNPNAVANAQSDSETARHEEMQMRTNDQRSPTGADLDRMRNSPVEPSAGDDVHPENKAKPSVGFAEPQATSRPASETITPAVSPDEEDSPADAQSGRPTTLSFISEKYAGLLGHGHRPGSTSSSSDILESPLYVARKRLLNQRGFPNPLVQPQTPQSDISIGVFQSVVDMLLPRPIGSISDLDTGASTPSSGPAQQTRNIGIQTQYEDDHLSSVIESENQKHIPKPKDHTRLVHASKWMVDSQTEFALKSLSLSQSSDAFHSSKQKREKYHIGMTLSEGSFAVVKQCKEKVTEKELLLRVINKAKVFGREDLILREVTIMKMLRQENVMQVVDHWETSDDMYLVMEQIEGSDLFDAILNCQHFCEADAAIAVRQLGMALVYLHANQIVHRDVKPENIFLTMDSAGGWILKLGGFSLAAVATEPLSLVCGNQYYRAPEMITETGYGTKLDVWAAGVVTYLIICGSLPFGRKNRTSQTSNALLGKIYFPTCYWSNISKEAKEFVKHLIKVSPSQRYSSSEMLQHPWIKDISNLNRPQSLDSTKLLDYLKSKASISPKVTSVPVLTVTALDHRELARPRHTRFSSNSEDIQR